MTTRLRPLHFTAAACLVVGPALVGACSRTTPAPAGEPSAPRIVFQSEPYAGGKTFGDIGAYDRITGTMYAEVDPADSHNRVLVDLDKAPRNARGRVEYDAQFVVLRPHDLSKANGTLVHTVPNRGNLGGVDEFRLRQGYILSWVAWQGDILPGNNRLLMRVPVATENGQPIVGRIRTEYTVETAGVFSLPLGAGAYTGNSHDSYPAVGTDNADAVLTMREREADPRVTVPTSAWSFAKCPRGNVPSTAGDSNGAAVQPSTTDLCIPAGFKRGWIYELIYDAKDPKVMSLGMASTRDFLSYLRFSPKDRTGAANPLFTGDASAVRRAIVTGASQTGRYSRQLLYLGFHVDVKDRVVIEGLWPHITTARLPINMRFAAPGRGFVQHEEHLFPSYEFPVAYNVLTDELTGRVDGVLKPCGETKTCPKIIHSVSGSEYWQERASLNTTDARGTTDLVLPDNVRFFYLTGTQHGPAAPGTRVPGAKHASNPGPQADSMRALLTAFDAWLRDGTAPPASLYPRLDDGTLVMPDQKSTGFPRIPGVTYAKQMNDLPLLDFGPEFLTRGIVGLHPPKIVSTTAWRPLVPRTDADGNDVAGLRAVHMLVPIGTYTGWNLRSREAGAEDELFDLQGTFVPFARTRAARLAAGDPRPSLEERYKTHEGYVERVKAAAADLVSKRLLLQEDADRLVREADESDILKRDR